jgi:hypothetical protein
VCRAFAVPPLVFILLENPRRANTNFVVGKAMEELKPNATGIYVAAHQAPAAIEEALAAEVPLIVAVAEHIPLHDMLRVGNKMYDEHGGVSGFASLIPNPPRYTRC